jgi:hypothetical protein
VVFAVAALVLIGFAQTPSPLDTFEAAHKSAMADASQMQKKLRGVNIAVLELVEQDRLKGASELRRASKLLLSQQGFQYAQVAYELTLAAAAGGDEPAKSLLGANWDNFLVCMSRGRRLGAVKMEGPFVGERYCLTPTAKAIISTYADLAAAAKRASTSKDNPDLQATVDADQKAREGSFTKFTTRQIIDMMKEDAGRRKQAKEIVFKGRLATAQDFFNAGLVFQHGETFEDYALAHELAVCSMLLGNKSAAWLAGASFDRMLTNCGYPQRFATQYSFDVGSSVTLTRVDTHWINDTERKLVVKLTLDEARNRKLE